MATPLTLVRGIQVVVEVKRIDFQFIRELIHLREDTTISRIQHNGHKGVVGYDYVNQAVHRQIFSHFVEFLMSRNKAKGKRVSAGAEIYNTIIEIAFVWHQLV